MSANIAYEVDASTGEILERVRTDAELEQERTQQEADAAIAEARRAAQVAKEANRDAVLEALAANTGLTTDEILEALRA